MSDTMINMGKIMAMSFAESKRRLPRDRDELIEWLMEFDRAVFVAWEKYQEATKDYVMTLNRPIVMKFDAIIEGGVERRRP